MAAFCSLTRPTRREIIQLDQLAHPLFDKVSAETRRYVAAALSDSQHAPRELARRLAAQPVDISAPLLMRSPVLTDVDLVGLIARHGLSHARVIARRRDLNPAIARLVMALSAAIPADPNESSAPSQPVTLAMHAPPAPPTAAERTRQSLRAIMGGQDAEPKREKSFAEAYRSALDAHGLYERFRTSLLAGDAEAFRQAVRAATGLDERAAGTIAEARDLDDLIAVFRHIGLGEEQAFLLVCAAVPGRFSSTGAIRAFLHDFRRLGREAASRRVAALRAEAGRPRGPRLVAVADAAPTSGADALRAS